MRAALGYFSTLPVAGRELGTRPLPQTIVYLPLVGIALGGLAGGAAYGTALVAPAPLAVAVAFGLSIVLTGALHVDGFLDACDALFAPVSPQRRLEILKDPHHGTFAVAYFAVVCVVWVAALAALPPARLVPAVAFAAGAARWNAVINLLIFPYGSSGRRPPALVLGLEALAILGLSALVAPWVWLAVPVGAALAAAGAAWAARRLGGVVTGDVYGALIVAEEVVILALCAVATVR
ncbi:MAG: adenosylcobinamide-GDP ribazoletransferase [Candidatus Eremiobacteraeota bacterium]|nr:adenosylcobinamide-GDP ribazoletransferase [Candidatus Eremiobacteraeota bacterium]